MKKTLLLTTLIASFSYGSFSQIALEYLNTLRKQANMIELQRNSILEEAAYNHNLYMNINQVYGHYEDSNKEGFTGVAPTDRAFYAGYEYAGVSENISQGQKDVYESIDGLFSAIYHRLGFLNEDINEIGLDENNRFYTYDMGNSYLNSLCQEDSTYDGNGAYYLGVCKDSNKKVSFERFNNELNKTRALAPDIILWPPKDASNIPPVFYEESPDPLPEYSVSGYPISVIFNVAKTPSIPKVNTFKLKHQNKELELITLMNKNNDPNKHFNDYQFAIFPKKRLQWGEKYEVELQYTINDKNKTINWCFSTRSLKEYDVEKYYEINTTNSSFNIEANKTYALYFPPQNATDTINRYSVSYNVQSQNIEFIDSNTLKIEANGNIGNILKIYVNDKTVTLTIANSDTAKEALNETCQDSNISIKIYDKTSFYIAYDESDGRNYALVMPMVNKIYVHKAGDIYNLKRVDKYFENFASYNNGELCFSNFKTDDTLSDSDKENKAKIDDEFNINAMDNKCYEVNYFYTQKDKVDNGVSFLLFFRPKSRLYEGLAGDGTSFKVVKDGAKTYNENSITNEDYSFIKFDLEKALIEIRSSCENVNAITGQCEDE